MSAENVQLVRELYAGFARGQFGVTADMVSPDFAYEPMADGRQPYVGFDEFVAQFSGFLDEWADFRIEAQEIEDLGDAVLVIEQQRGKGTRSGVETASTFAAVWTFRDGVIVRARWDLDRDAALRAHREI
jgi:ketosteroid isomerase-like protein